MKAAKLQAIAEDISGHLPCEFEICNEATNRVPGEGNPDADVVFVGEAPGGSEDKQGRPFVGNAGRFLAQLAVIEPKVIVPLGRQALAHFAADVKITLHRDARVLRDVL